MWSLGGSLPISFLFCFLNKMVLHLHVTTFFFLLFFISSHHSPVALQSPTNCFDRGSTGGYSTCELTIAYPLLDPSYPGDSCGYPGLFVDCNSPGGRSFVNISSHIYRVLRVEYSKFNQIRIVDTEVDGQECPQPKRNFSLPSSPSWVYYHLSYPYNLTIFYNCSGVPVDAKQKHLLCSDDYYNTTNTSPSYAFYDFEIPEQSFDWYGKCAENVVVPFVDYLYDRNYTNAIRSGFFMNWKATDWCGDCEGSGGQCWSSSLDNSTGCACRDNKSYKTCSPAALPTPKGVSPTPKGVLPAPNTTQHRKQGISTGLKIGFGILGGTGGLLLVAFLVYWGGVKHSYLSMFHWRYKNKSPINVEAFLEKYGCLALQRYRYSDIRKMTNSFKDVLGQGGYGRVFKGELRDGRMVAVKVLNETKGDGEDFINEVATIGRTNHVNVVSLIGFCIEGSQRALVYEFMSNGSLERFIFTQKESSTALPLGWEMLYQIALGIARGLEYLHRGCNTRILHFDIKPHNILLDENFCPKISDFGLAKLYPTRESIVSTVGARGTMGYIAPELYYRNFGNVSHKSDVYSYGMMMLEMIGGRKNIDPTMDNISEIYFPVWIYNHLKRHNDAKGLEEIQAREVFKDENAKRMTMVALWCIQMHPVDRPSMSKVVEMLEGNNQELQMPPNPSVDPRSSSSTSS